MPFFNIIDIIQNFCYNIYVILQGFLRWCSSIIKKYPTHGGLVKWLTHTPFTRAFTGSNPVPVTNILPGSQAVRHKTLTLAFPWFESRSGNQMVRWCSGYHARLSRERSRVQVPYGPPFDYKIFIYRWQWPLRSSYELRKSKPLIEVKKRGKIKLKVSFDKKFYSWDSRHEGKIIIKKT